MILDLPAPDRPRLAGAPLEVVVWQLQFADPVDVSSGRVGQAVAEALSDVAESRPKLTRIAPATVTLALGGAGAPGIQAQSFAAPAAPGQHGASQSTGWQIRADDLAVTITQAAIAVETTSYDVWKTFRAAIASSLDGLLGALDEAPSEQRLGLRYIDRLSRPEISKLTDWEGWLEPWLLGPILHPQVGEAISATAQQIDCDAGDGMTVTLRQRGFVDLERRNRQTIVLDFDAFREGYRAVDHEDVLAATDALSDISHRLFRAAITDRLYDVLREEPQPQ